MAFFNSVWDGSIRKYGAYTKLVYGIGNTPSLFLLQCITSDDRAYDGDLAHFATSVSMQRVGNILCFFSLCYVIHCCAKGLDYGLTWCEMLQSD